MPTATIRPPAAARRVERGGGLGRTRRPTPRACGGRRCRRALTGRKVPARHAASPCARAMPAASSRANSAVGEMQPGGRRRDRALLAREDRLVVARGRPRPRPAGRRCRAAAACGRWRAIASSSTGAGEVEAEQHLARLALLLDRRVEPGDEAGIVAGRAEADRGRRRRGASPGRAKACQRDGSTRSMQRHRDPAPRCRRGSRSPCSSAGITLVSLRTSTSPGASRSAGRGHDGRRAPRPASTTSSRAASRGRAGRSAIRSSGRSKSKRSTRMPDDGQPRRIRCHDRNRPAPATPRPRTIRMTGQITSPVDVEVEEEHERRARSAPAPPISGADATPGRAGCRSAGSSSRRRRAQ